LIYNLPLSVTAKLVPIAKTYLSLLASYPVMPEIDFAVLLK
jgi:hypothetical protein